MSGDNNDAIAESSTAPDLNQDPIVEGDATPTEGEGDQAEVTQPVEKEDAKQKQSQSVPYSRFKEVTEQKNELAKKLDELQAQIASFNDQKVAEKPQTIQDNTDAMDIDKVETPYQQFMDSLPKYKFKDNYESIPELFGDFQRAILNNITQLSTLQTEHNSKYEQAYNEGLDLVKDQYFGEDKDGYSNYLQLVEEFGNKMDLAEVLKLYERMYPAKEPVQTEQPEEKSKVAKSTKTISKEIDSADKDLRDYLVSKIR